MGRLVVAWSVTAGTLFVATPAAAAWSTSVQAGTLSVLAGPGEANQFSAAIVSGQVQVTDLGGNAADVVVPAGCSRPLPQRVVCAGIVSLSIDAGDLADSVSDVTGLAGTVLSGGAGDDVIQGGPASDVISGGPGADLISGGPGADTLSGDDGDDQIDGGSGDDELRGGAGKDRLAGDAGLDTLFGDDDDDLLEGGLGDDALDGGAGRDQLDGDEGLDSLLGGLDDDRLTGGAESDVLAGGAGDDELRGQDGGDVLVGDAGNDVADGGDGSDTLLGGSGSDRLDGGSGADVVSGGLDGDSLSGGGDADVLLGDDGDDVLSGNDGNDVVGGGSGTDELSGGEGADALAGGADSDVLRGGPGADELSGDDGDDRLDGGAGADDLKGGAGVDAVDYGSRASSVFVNVGAGPGSGEAGENDVVEAGIERVLGGAGNDVLRAEAATAGVELAGGFGADLLAGSGFADVLNGGPGNDELTGNLGADVLEGGDGGDLASYRERTARVVVTLDGLANDGEDNEGDTVRTENVATGTGDDLLVGAAGDNEFFSGAGNDELIVAGDPGSTDVLYCGEGIDRHHTDGDDAPADDCETDVLEVRRVQAATLAEQQRLNASGVEVANTSLTMRRSGPRWFTRAAVRCRSLSSRFCRVRLGAVVGRGRHPVTLRWTEVTIKPGDTRMAEISVSARALARIRKLPLAERRQVILRVLAYDASEVFERQMVRLSLRGHLFPKTRGSR